MFHPAEMSVRNGPHWIVLTRTEGPRARAKPSVSALSPALAAAYGRTVPSGRIEATDEMLTTTPPSPETIRSPMRAVSRKGPLRLTATTLSHSFSLTAPSDG